jgi:hypothetical protein
VGLQDKIGEISNVYDPDGAYTDLHAGKEIVEETLLSIAILEESNRNKDDQHGVHFLMESVKSYVAFGAC